MRRGLPLAHLLASAYEHVLLVHPFKLGLHPTHDLTHELRAKRGSTVPLFA